MELLVHVSDNPKYALAWNAARFHILKIRNFDKIDSGCLRKLLDNWMGAYFRSLGEVDLRREGGWFQIGENWKRIVLTIFTTRLV